MLFQYAKIGIKTNTKQKIPTLILKISSLKDLYSLFNYRKTHLLNGFWWNNINATGLEKEIYFIQLASNKKAITHQFVKE